MKLIEYSIEKYRSINERIILPIHDISVLIGQNGGGKTTTLDALNLFFEIRSTMEEKDDINNKNSEVGEIIFSCEFEITDQERNFFQKYNKDLKKGERLTIFKKFDIRKNESYYFIYALGTGTALDNLNLGSNRAPYEKLCKIHNIDYGKKNIDQMKEELQCVCDQLPKKEQVEKKIDKNSLRNYLPRYILLSSENSPDPKRKMIEILKSTLKDQVKELNIDNEVNTITNVVIDVCNQKIREANTSIKKYCKDIEKIDINPRYEVLQGLNLDEFNIIKVGGTKVKFESESTGKRKQIMLGLYEWSNLQITEDLSDNFIIAFDEPDLHFDYIQISNLLEILKNFSEKENVQVVVVTHSIKLIDNFPPNHIAHFGLNKNDETELLTITDDEYVQIGEFLKNLSFSIGFRSAFLFFEKIFVIVEGDSEYKAFPILFELINERTHFEAGISFINAEDNIQALKFAKFLRDNKRMVVLIVDRASKKRKEFRESGLRKLGFMEGKDLFFAGKESDSEGEFEGEFTSEQWIKMLNESYTKKSGEEWVIEEIDFIRGDGKISEKIVNLIEKNCVEQASKPVLAKKIAKSIEMKSELSQNLTNILYKINSKSSSVW
ncbi:hypothetical protein LCGC14_0709970 [marine sediment metagenome]|uniref:Uncharacterized protein n=1 Tax=marine sediment metagenome TaxID=412755 RepID=A0A0F9QJU4_9ZZZZ